MALVKLIFLGVLAAALSCTAVFAEEDEKIVFCYYGTWATYREGLGQFNTSDVSTTLCTHVTYAFMGINDLGEVISLDPTLDLPDNDGRNNLAEFTALKKQNPKLKALFSVGGWNEGSAKYSELVADPARRAAFIKTCLYWIIHFGFDGIDLDWEYPARRDTVHGDADIENFTQMLKELREAFDKQAEGLLLTAAVSAVESAASLSYNIPEISKSLDLINIMTYDLNGAWDPFTGFNSPLYRGEGDENVPEADLLTVDAAIKYWLKAGAPANKIVMGIPLYGKTYTLTDSNQNGVRAPASGVGMAGPFSQEAGTILYAEMCVILKDDSSWVQKYDDNAQVPYAYKDTNWVSYDNPKSVAAKTEYAKSLNLAGVMVWSVESDDFNGQCGETNPLLKTINRVLGKNF